MDFKQEIGRRIRAARDAADLSLEELSKHISGALSPSRISNYEQGTRLPGPREILILSKALLESPTHLMCLDEGDDMLTEEAEFLRNWRALPENERRSYAKRISVLALAYRESVPDEKVARSLPKPQKHRATKPA